MLQLELEHVDADSALHLSITRWLGFSPMKPELPWFCVAGGFIRAYFAREKPTERWGRRSISRTWRRGGWSTGRA